MNRKTAATMSGDSNERYAGNICWSSEWSFIEDTEIASQKRAQPFIAEKQPARSHAGTGASSP